MKTTSSIIDWAVLKKSSSSPLDLSMAIWLVAKCPSCDTLIRFKLSGYYGLGWSLRTFYCKHCKQTHSITMFFESKKSAEQLKYTDLTQSLWRASGSRILRKAHDHLPMGISISNPAKLLGCSSHKIAKWVQAYINVFIQHLESTRREKDLHLLEIKCMNELISKLQYMKSLLSYFINKGE